MGKQTITELPNILTEGIDYDNTLAEMKAIIENNPNWKENWTSFYNSEAGSLLTQLMAWISDNLATKQDVIFNEMFIGTAQADKNKIRHLNQIGYSPTMAKSAKGKMHIETNNISQTDIILTPRRDVEEDISERVNNIFKFNGTDINGDTKIYEILQYKNGKPDYMSEVSLTAGQTEFEVDTNGNAIYAYEGRTTYEEFYSDTSDGPTFELALENIEDGSIRVYDTSDNNIEFNNVSSFVSIEAKDETTAVPYVIEYTVNKTYRIRFATRGVMTYSGKVNYDRLYPAGHTIGVLYRTTNGSLGNSPIGFLTSTSTVKNRNGDSIQITLYSSNREIHDELVGANNFDKTVEGIKNALEAGLNVSINTPLCTTNKDYVETLKFLNELGVKYVSCSGLIVTGNAKKEESKQLQLTSEELYKVLQKSVQYCNENLMEISFTSPGWIENKKIEELGLDIPSCGACLSNMAVAPNGDVVPCQSWLSQNGKLGNMLKDNWKDIWQSKKCKNIRNTSSKAVGKCLLKGDK